MKVSVVISAYNSEQKIEDCLKSVQKVASEIIFVDNTSADKTLEIAKKYTEKVFVRQNNPTMFNTNKNFGFTKTESEWILNLDADERLTDELSNEILNLKEDPEVCGYYIPRKNMIFGKWIEHTGWYPDYQLRLFKKEKGRFEEKHIHELLFLDGPAGKLSNSMVHMNYDSISQFLEKMIKNYTLSEAQSQLESGHVYKSSDLYSFPVSEFMKRYFLEKGYKDGVHGLILSTLMAFYHFVVAVRLWEASEYKEERNSFDILQKGSKKLSQEFAYWKITKEIEDENNIIKKNALKIKRKITKP